MFVFGRTFYCGEVTEDQIGQTVVLKGWVQKRRDLGGLIFIDLRDRTGIVQVVFNPDLSKEALETAESIRNEYVLDIKGTVVAREEATINPNLKTGKIEIQVRNGHSFKRSKDPSFCDFRSSGRGIRRCALKIPLPRSSPSCDV